jgi:hypothetical protein
MRPGVILGDSLLPSARRWRLKTGIFIKEQQKLLLAWRR